jgi:hypothetical protein
MVDNDSKNNNNNNDIITKEGAIRKKITHKSLYIHVTAS